MIERQRTGLSMTSSSAQSFSAYGFIRQFVTRTDVLVHHKHGQSTETQKVILEALPYVNELFRTLPAGSSGDIIIAANELKNYAQHNHADIVQALKDITKFSTAHRQDNLLYESYATQVMRHWNAIEGYINIP